MLVPISSDGGEYKKARDKIIRLIHEFKGVIQLPPESPTSWESLERDVLAELSQYKDQVPATVTKCVVRLKMARDFNSARREVLNCIDIIGTLIQKPKAEIGFYQGALGRMIVKDQSLQQNLIPIVAKIIQVLEA